MRGNSRGGWLRLVLCLVADGLSFSQADRCFGYRSEYLARHRSERISSGLKGSSCYGIVNLGASDRLQSVLQVENNLPQLSSQRMICLDAGWHSPTTAV